MLVQFLNGTAFLGPDSLFWNWAAMLSGFGTGQCSQLQKSIYMGYMLCCHQVRELYYLNTLAVNGSLHHSFNGRLHLLLITLVGSLCRQYFANTHIPCVVCLFAPYFVAWFFALLPLCCIITQCPEFTTLYAVA